MKDSWFFSSSSTEKSSSWLESSSSRCSISLSLMSTCLLVLLMVADSLMFSDSKIRSLEVWGEGWWWDWSQCSPTCPAASWSPWWAPPAGGWGGSAWGREMLSKEGGGTSRCPGDWRSDLKCGNIYNWLTLSQTAQFHGIPWHLL